MNDYRRWEDYFWPDAPDVLRNKLGIRDQRMLNFVEAQLSAVRIYEQVLENRTGAFNFAHYCDIHRRTFSDIFDWAGIPRTVPDGPMTKRHRDVVNFLINDPTHPPSNTDTGPARRCAIVQSMSSHGSKPRMR